MPDSFSTDAEIMQHAIRIAGNGFGRVEPNPVVGAVIVDSNRQLIAEGFHQSFGEAHAEINAIRAAGAQTSGNQLFVSLEPCSHFGKTPPCADAVIAAGFRRVVIGCGDPAPHVAGRGIQKLLDAGIHVEVGLCEELAKRLIAPFRMLMLEKRPWVHAKWAMTLDGRIAASTGHSKWISGETSRALVHNLRGRVDAIITGSGTVRADNPLLTARPRGARTALGVVVDSTGDSVTAESNLTQSLMEAPVLVCVSQRCSPASLARLHSLGAQTFQSSAQDDVDVTEVLQELGRRQCTNVMLEAGPRLIGAFCDQGLIDEVSVFVAPKMIGGNSALSPIGGKGLQTVPESPNLQHMKIHACGDDLLIQADVTK